MSNQEYLQQLLNQQELTSIQVSTLRGLRDRIQNRLSQLTGNPRFYYAGSYGKKTMIKDRFDLDVVAYWPSDCGFDLKEISDAVGAELRKEWQYVNQKTVAWELPFNDGFHLDVVPGRAIDGTFRYANLYRRDTGTWLQTSIKVHIDTVRDSGRRDAIRLMKLWRSRNRVPWKKSLALELITIAGSSGCSKSDLEPQLTAALRHVRDNIESVRLVDPANSNNIVSDELTTSDRRGIKSAAQAALAATYWSDVFQQRS